MTLTGFDIHFDIKNNTILILKTPNTPGRAAVIEIRPSNEKENDSLKAAFETADTANLRGYFEIQINKN